MKNTHHCIICGKGYISCDSCRNVRSFMPWRTIACSEKHYQFYLLIRACQREDANVELVEQLEQMAQSIEMKESVCQDVQTLLKHRE